MTKIEKNRAYVVKWQKILKTGQIEEKLAKRGEKWRQKGSKNNVKLKKTGWKNQDKLTRKAGQKW